MVKKLDEGHSDAVSCMAVTQSGLKLVTGGHDSCLKVWDLSQIGTNADDSASPALLVSLENVHQRKYDEGVLGLAIHPSLSCLVTGGADSVIQVYEMLP